MLLLYQGLSISQQAYEGLMSTPVAGSQPWSAITTSQNATTGFMRDKYTVTPLNPAMQTQCDLRYGSFCPRIPPHLYGLHRSSVMGQGKTKQLFNIIKSGDIQPNPGPVKNHVGYANVQWLEHIDLSDAAAAFMMYTLNVQK